VTAAPDEHRVLGRYLVELPAGRETLFLELAFVPIARGLDPAALRRGGGAGANPLEQRVDRVDIGHADFLEIRRQPSEVDVRIVEPGDDRLATGVDRPRLGRGEPHDRGARSDRDDPAVANRHRLGTRVVAVQGDDVGVVDDEVGRALRQRAG
jgi:hypothetical protein